MSDLVQRLRDLRIPLKSGEYDGTTIMDAWILAEQAADEIEHLKALDRSTAVILGVHDDQSISDRVEELLDNINRLTKQLEEARADYHHELLETERLNADLAYIRRRTGFTGGGAA